MVKRIGFFLIALFVISGIAVAETIPVPTGQESLIYNPTADPLVSMDLKTAKPIGVGAVARGGDTLSLRVSLGQFSGPVDIYMALYAPDVDPANIYILRPDSTLQPLSKGLIAWKENTRGPIEESLGNIPTSTIPAEVYYLYLMVTPSAQQQTTVSGKTQAGVPTAYTAWKTAAINTKLSGELVVVFAIQGGDLLVTGSNIFPFSVNKGNVMRFPLGPDPTMIPDPSGGTAIGIPGTIVVSGGSVGDTKCPWEVNGAIALWLTPEVFASGGGQMINLEVDGSLMDFIWRNQCPEIPPIDMSGHPLKGNVVLPLENGAELVSPGLLMNFKLYVFRT